MSFTTIIMAGGLGKRMKSDKPKVLNLLNGRPLIYYVIQSAICAGSNTILIIVGKYKEMIKNEVNKLFSDFADKIYYITQPEVLINGELKVQGTGNAIKHCLPFFIEQQTLLSERVLILSGDVPLIQPQTLSLLLDDENSILITELENPFGCGRIVFSDNKQIKEIIEEKDCTEEERTIKYVNCGIYNFTVELLMSCVPEIKNINKNNEYYLTDAISIAKQKGFAINYYDLPRENSDEIININTKEDLLFAASRKN